MQYLSVAVHCTRAIHSSSIAIAYRWAGVAGGQLH